MDQEAVFVINPGSTSTKIAFYSREGELFSTSIPHSQNNLMQFERIAGQLEYRYNQILPYVREYLEKSSHKVVGVVSRGGIVKPLRGGTYRINSDFLKDAESGEYGEHASNLGGLLAEHIRGEFGLQESYTVDPVSTSNISKIAEISGVPGILRNGRAHTLNMKSTARKIAQKQGIPFEDSQYVIAHLGGGISIGLIRGGILIDVNDGLLGMGPFTPNRAGALPLRGVMRLCYTMPEAEVRRLFSQNSGFKAYLGTEDVREVMQMVEQGNEKAALVYGAFVYQVAKEIGANFAASKGQAQAIGITGGIAHNDKFIADLKDYTGNLTEFHVHPGESEMEALAKGIFRVLDKKEAPLDY